MTDPAHALAISLFSELLTADQLLRNRLTRVLPDRMEISHFSVLNHLARASGERTPAQLARRTRRCRHSEAALAAMAPLVSAMMTEIGPDRVRAALPVLRELRLKLEAD